MSSNKVGGKGNKSGRLLIDNSQSLKIYNAKPHLSRIVKFEDLINKENMTQIMQTNIDKYINDTFKYEKKKFKKQ